MLMVNQLVGFGAGGESVDGFDPLKTHASATLSNGDLTMTVSGATIFSALGKRAKSTGKWYAEFLIVDIGSDPFIAVGIAKSTMLLTDYVGFSNSYSYIYYGSVVPSGAGGHSTYTTGDVVQIAFDSTDGKIWFGKNNTFVGNPATASTPAASSITGTYYLAATCRAGGSVTMRESVGLSYSPPSGFTAWGA